MLINLSILFVFILPQWSCQNVTYTEEVAATNKCDINLFVFVFRVCVRKTSKYIQIRQEKKKKKKIKKHFLKIVIVCLNLNDGCVCVCVEWK